MSNRFTHPPQEPEKGTNSEEEIARVFASELHKPKPPERHKLPLAKFVEGKGFVVKITKPGGQHEL